MINGQLVGGVWLPKTETHMVDVMTGKDRREVDGKLTYQYLKLQRALSYLPMEFRRLALDIGGHVGLWSMWLAREFAGVEAFEPVPLHGDLFEVNVPAGNVRLHRIAIGSSEGMIDMQVPDETTGNAHVAIDGRHPGTKLVAHPDRQQVHAGIPMRTIDSFGFQKVDFIKIDVEGFEKAVVQGAEETIRRCHPIIVLEQKGNESAYGDEPMAAAKLLMSWGLKEREIISGDWILGFG